MHRITGAQHRHSPYRAAVDVQAVHPVAQLQPSPAAIDTELDVSILDTLYQTGLAVGIMADRVHSRAQHQVGTFTVWESKSEGIHAGEI
ncbi:MAG: hypothetical protein ACOH1P_00995 [Lysobacter sp.]